MILLELFAGFFKVGCFAFGGAYGAIPLIRDVVLSNGWLDEEMLTGMIAVSESTPGPIMVNLATYVGSSQAGFFGAVTATLAVVLPSFLIILLVTALLKTALKNHRCHNDDQKRHCSSGWLNADPSSGIDPCAWRDILRFQKNQKRRHITGTADHSFRSGGDRRVWLLKLNSDLLCSRRLIHKSVSGCFCVFFCSRNHVSAAFSDSQNHII